MCVDDSFSNRFLHINDIIVCVMPPVSLLCMDHLMGKFCRLDGWVKPFLQSNFILCNKTSAIGCEVLPVVDQMSQQPSN